jgi:secreted trypsin-like serine protease
METAMKKYAAVGSLLLAFSSLGHAVMNGRTADAAGSAQSVKIKMDSSDGFECTAVVVGRHLLLTAGHCTEGVTEKTPSVKISNRLNGMNEEELHVRRWATAPGYRVTKPQRKKRWFSKEEPESKSTAEVQFDLAYLVVQEDLVNVFRLRVEQVPLLVGDESSLQAALKETQSLAIGYGYGVYSGSTSGLKKQLNLQVEVAPETKTLKAHSLEKSVGLCQGDSGGGLFLRAQSQGPLLLTGILSGITPGQPCGSALSVAVYVDLTPHLCWIQKDSGISLGDLNCQQSAINDMAGGLRN